MTTDNNPEFGTRCCARVHSGNHGGTRLCMYMAGVIRDGKPYCGRHDPAAIKARKDKRNAEWEERWEAGRAASAKAEAERAERDRRAERFDDLLAALEIMTGLAKLKCASRGDEIWADEIGKADAAIAKARGA